jgi:hypothetical protein
MGVYEWDLVLRLMILRSAQDDNLPLSLELNKQKRLWISPEPLKNIEANSSWVVRVEY